MPLTAATAPSNTVIKLGEGMESGGIGLLCEEEDTFWLIFSIVF